MKGISGLSFRPYRPFDRLDETKRPCMGRHLAYADGRATAMLESLITQMVKQEGVTEQLKAEQPMEWVGRMNNIRSRAEEIVMEEVINTL